MSNRNRREETAAANARQQRYRVDLKNGVKTAPTKYDNDMTGYLIDIGWLAMGKSEDPKEVGKAISNMLRDSAGLEPWPDERTR